MPTFNRISQLVFKTLLLCVYTALFSVEVYFRYVHPQADVSYQTIASYTLEENPSTHTERLVKTGHAPEEILKTHTKHKKGIWLNKRFSPVSPATLATLTFDTNPEYVIVRKIYFSYDQHIITTNTDHASLRAPPAIS